MRELFLFRMADERKGLRRDERSMLAKGLCSASLALILIDFVVFAFFLRTNQRLNDIRAHNFTVALDNAVAESRATHGEFSNRAKEVNMEMNYELKEMFSNVRNTLEEIDSLETFVPELPNLPKLLRSIEGAAKDHQKLGEVEAIFREVEREHSTLSEKLSPLEALRAEVRTTESAISSKFDQINHNLDEYYKVLSKLARTQNDNQFSIYKAMGESIHLFNRHFSEIERNGRAVRLNGRFSFEFLDFDRDLVPFFSEFGGHSGAWMTKSTSVFSLRLSRVYICTLKAHVSSDREFAIRFELADIPGKKDSTLYSTSTAKGTYLAPTTIDESFVFTLEEGEHRLALRIVAAGDASMVSVRRPALQCLSYRHFTKKP